MLQGEAAYIYFGCCPPGRLGTAHSNVQHGPGGRLTGFSARFDSRYVIATDRSRAMPKHSCTRAQNGGLPHGACCSRATLPDACIRVSLQRGAARVHANLLT